MRAMLIVLLLATAPAMAQDGRYCGPPARDADGVNLRRHRVQRPLGAARVLPSPIHPQPSTRKGRTMKRLFTIICAALALTGCAGLDIGGLADPIVRVAETLDDDNTSTKGATTGMSSGDARDVLINRAYYGAVKAIHGADKKDAGSLLLVDIEPMDGQPIVIHAKRFKVYAPPPQAGGAAPLAIAPPTAKKSLFKEVSEEARGWFRDALVPIRISDNQSETQRLQIVTNGQIRQTELGIMNNAVTGSQDIAGQAITTFKPLVVHAPVAAPAAAETSTATEP